MSKEVIEIGTEQQEIETKPITLLFHNPDIKEDMEKRVILNKLFESKDT